MTSQAPASPAPAERLSLDFWKFWLGQTISNLGTSVTGFILPLLIFKLTGSALNLALATVFTMLPYPLFGLLIGAWVDRTDRKRLMLAADLLRGVLIALIPLLGALDVLSIWMIYGIAFLSSSLGICFNAAEFAAIPSLVPREKLVEANGKIQASYSAATIAGPLLAGVLLAVLPLQGIVLLDAVSFFASAGSLLLIRRSFNPPTQAARPDGSLRQNIVEGLRYVLRHPVLRNISLMMALINLIATTRNAQLVLFAKRQFVASDTQVSLLFSAGSAGVLLLSLAAGPLRRRWSFSSVALGSLMLSGLLTVALAFAPWFWLAVVLWGLSSGLNILFNINTGSLRQAIVPGELLGRVITVAMVLAWSANPLGSLAGGAVIERTGNVQLVYALIGALTFAIALGFRFTALGRAEQYLPEQQPAGGKARPAGQPAVGVSGR